MNCRALLAALAGLVATAGCRDRAADSPDLGPLTRQLLEVAKAAGHPPGSTTVAELERVARQVAAARAGGLGAVAALNRTVFEDLGYAREIEERGGRFMLLPPVLGSRRGSCVGLGTLYLALAEKLGIAAHGVLVPGHFFVRVADGDGATLTSVELLRQGEAMPERWYRDKYGVPASGATAYLRALTPAEVTAVVHFNLGNEQREATRLAEARAHYEKAVAGFPDFPEAQASLGLTLHLLGRLPEARAAYQQAARLHPGLPGLARNVEVLEQEMATTR